MIRVLTIEREYGSGAAEIAKLVADRLGWELWDQLLTSEIARLMGCDCRAVEGPPSENRALGSANRPDGSRHSLVGRLRSMACYNHGPRKTRGQICSCSFSLGTIHP